MPAPGQTPLFRDLFAETFRHLVGLVVWGIGVGCALVIDALVLNAHYLSTSSALELLGEQKPFGLDPVIGVYLGSLLENASQSHFRAMTIVLVIALGSLILAHLLSNILTLIEHRAAYGQAMAALGQDNPTAAAEFAQARSSINYKILFLTVWLAIVGAMVGTVAYWDYLLNWYQQVASSAGIDQPGEAASAIQVPAQEMARNGHLVAWNLASLGAFGFLTVMFLGALVLEYSTRRLSDRWGKLVNTVAELINFGNDDPGAQEFEMGTQDSRLPPSVQPAPEVAPGQPNRPAGAPLFDAPPASENPTAVAAPSTSSADAAQVDRVLEVIGGVAGERVTLDEALRNPARYYVDRDTELVWNRAYHDALTQTGDRL